MMKSNKIEAIGQQHIVFCWISLKQQFKMDTGGILMTWLCSWTA